jgi:hypothetical protein
LDRRSGQRVTLSPSEAKGRALNVNLMMLARAAEVLEGTLEEETRAPLGP